jgi:hypothetical protein
VFAHDLHVGLAVATVVALAVAAVEAAVRLFTARPPGRFSAAISPITLVVVGMTAAGGLAMLARGERPREFLHFIYAAVAFVLIPLGDSLSAPSAPPRRRAAVRFFSAVVALGVVARLFATG